MKNTRLEKEYPKKLKKVEELIKKRCSSRKISMDLKLPYEIILDYKNLYNQVKKYSKNKNYFTHGKQEPYFEDENLQRA